ncbi:MAG TPA: bacteriohopanetetrol glucosamine biosynthesis glycosyltransferase HpnI [Candidatus Dormibacteraeota bacterium]|nr:bacteriohopanetetrol glucosamine biosynthesis glycosyltransferase HpnI [Candidatus Dormibacteraeota bacterium]
MAFRLFRDIIFLLAVGSYAYYLLTLWVSVTYFRHNRRKSSTEVTHPLSASILKPVRGLDFAAYENFASFCQQDYPEYEVLFCVNDADDPAVPVIAMLQRAFPACAIRLLVGAEVIGSSDKVNKLCRLAREAKYDLLVVSDSDVRVPSDYLRDVAEPFADPAVGALTVLFRSVIPGGFGATLDAAGSAVEFASSALLAQQLEGIKFTLGATMAITRKVLAEIGGFERLASHYVDDFELGNRVAARGYRVELARTPVCMVYGPETLGQFLRHELRWTIGLRSVRPVGHVAMMFTFGLPWTILAATLAPSIFFAVLWLLAYMLLRISVYVTVGVWGLRDSVVRRAWWLAPLRDAANVGVWLASFVSDRFSWREVEYQVKNGLLIPINEAKAANLVAIEVAPRKTNGGQRLK